MIPPDPDRVRMPGLCFNTDEPIFSDPWGIHPGRCLDSVPPDAERRNLNMAVRKGGRSCVGIDLAHTDMVPVMVATTPTRRGFFETDSSDAGVSV